MARNKILYIGEKILSPQGGAEQINLRNQRLLEDLFPEMISYVGETIKKPLKLHDKFYLGASDKLIKDVVREISTGCYKYAFISQSLWGRVAKTIKKTDPSICIIAFFHNIEIQYAKEYCKASGIKALPFYFAVKYWEKTTCCYSDKFITLNSRDSYLLKTIYNKKTDLELPTSLEDRYCESKKMQLEEKCKENIDYLFVGVAFFANIHGIQWFIDNVMPKVGGNLYIIGKGMEQVAFKNLNEKIHIKGFVEDLSYYYYNAKCVVSPIFLGGGMKTKTAEALMYGKTIVGTTEAFRGYELDKRCTIVCNTPEEFEKAIKTDCPKFNHSSRELFDKFYSLSSSKKILKRFFVNCENKD